MSCAWIPVDVGEGMFSTEYVVVVHLSSGEHVEVFVDKYLVKLIEGRHYLKSILLGISPEVDTVRVVLPQAPAFSESTPLIEVMYSSCIIN